MMGKGFQGMYQGRIGSLSYYVRNGRQLVRRCGWKVSTQPSDAQLASRMRLALVVDLLRPLLSVVNVGFAPKALGTGKTAYNLASGYHLKNAVSGVYPMFEIDYSKVKISLAAGGVSEPLMAKVTLCGQGLKFSWVPDAAGAWSLSSDQAMMLAYFPGQATALFDIYGPCRSKGEGILKLTPAQMTLGMEVYLAFIAADRLGISDSIYLGNING